MTTYPAVAQGLVDALAAAALAARLHLAIGRKVAVPSQIRPALLFATLCLFYACRGCAELFDLPGLAFVSMVVIALVPISALLLAEGLARRHAPTPLKLLICIAALAEVIWLLATAKEPTAASWGLAFEVLGALIALTVLLSFRRRRDLSPHENGTIDAVLLAAAGLLPLGITDFGAGWPLGVSGLGATLLAVLSQKSFGSPKAALKVALEVTALGLFGLAFGIGLCDLLKISDPIISIQIYACSVGMVLSTICVLAATQASQGVASGLALRQALVQIEFDSLTALLDRLADQPMLKGMLVLQGTSLTDFDAGHLLRALHSGVAGIRQKSQVSEQLSELMQRHGASHAILLRSTPLTLGLLALSEIGGSVETETDLGLLSRLALSIPSNAPQNMDAACH